MPKLLVVVLMLAGVLAAEESLAMDRFGWVDGANTTGCAFNDLQEAIDDAPGAATVFVQGGAASNEGIVIDKALVLQRGNPQCDGPGLPSQLGAILRNTGGGTVVRVTTDQQVVLSDLSILNGVSDTGGGNLHIEAGGQVFVDDCRIAGGVTESPSRGGGNVWIGADSTVDFVDTLIEGGEALDIVSDDSYRLVGGNLFVDHPQLPGQADANVSLIRTTVSGGVAPRGGGIYAHKIDLRLVDSVIEDNESEQGAGLFLIATDAELLGETRVQKNRATIPFTEDLAPGLGGGGFVLVGGSMDIDAATRIRRNQAADDFTYGGGGLLADHVAFSGTAPDLYPAPHLTMPVDSSLGAIIRRNRAALGGGLGVVVRHLGASITGGRISRNRANDGGGFFVRGYIAANLPGITNPQVEFRDMVLESNRALDQGGGVGMTGHLEATAERMSVQRNAAQSGGGVAVVSDAPQNMTAEFSDLQLIRNSAEAGAGVFVRGGEVRVTASRCEDRPIDRCTLLQANRAGNQGGAWFVDGFGTLDVEHVTALDNQAGSAGSLGYVAHPDAVNSIRTSLVSSRVESDVSELTNSGTLEIDAVTIDGATERRAVIFTSGSAGYFRNSILFESGRLINESGAVLSAECSLVTDVDGDWDGADRLHGPEWQPDYQDQNALNFRLGENSDAVDQCNFGLAVDLDSEMRPSNGQWDFGAYESD